MIVLNIISFQAHFRLIMSLQTIFRYSDLVAKYSRIKRIKLIMSKNNRIAMSYSYIPSSFKKRLISCATISGLPVLSSEAA